MSSDSGCEEEKKKKNVGGALVSVLRWRKHFFDWMMIFDIKRFAEFEVVIKSNTEVMASMSNGQQPKTLKTKGKIFVKKFQLFSSSPFPVSNSKRNVDRICALNKQGAHTQARAFV